MTDELQASYSHCARVARRAASSFYYSFYLLPGPQRRAMNALYAYLRRTEMPVHLWAFQKNLKVAIVLAVQAFDRQVYEHDRPAGASAFDFERHHLRVLASDVVGCRAGGARVVPAGRGAQHCDQAQRGHPRCPRTGPAATAERLKGWGRALPRPVDVRCTQVFQLQPAHALPTVILSAIRHSLFGSFPIHPPVKEISSLVVFGYCFD